MCVCVCVCGMELSIRDSVSIGMWRGFVYWTREGVCVYVLDEGEGRVLIKIVINSHREQYPAIWSK